jgi:hypothetical protein
MVPYIHIWDFLGVKMLPYIHILGFFLVKMLPYSVHIFFLRGGQNAAILVQITWELTCTFKRLYPPKMAFFLDGGLFFLNKFANF